MSKIFNKKDVFVLIVGILAVIVGVVYTQLGVGLDNQPKVVNYQQPIIFVSDQNRTSSAAQHLVTTTSRSGGSIAMHVDVYDNGKIEYLANKNVRRAKQPIIEVSFSGRTNTTKEQSAKLKEILVHLNHKYNYKTYDAIGFGAGALTVYYNAVTYGVKHNQMRLSHFISIAGPYQGILVDPHVGQNDHPNPNEPNHVADHQNHIIERQNQQRQLIDAQQAVNNRFPSYADLKKKANNLDENTKVLNIYGVLNSTNKSDGRVSEQSAAALKNLVRNGNYQSLRLTGPYALHTNILDNQISERLVNRFLFSD